MTFTDKLINLCKAINTTEAELVLEVVNDYWFDEDAYSLDPREAYNQIVAEI